jgi:hypothetical protein
MEVFALLMLVVVIIVAAAFVFFRWFKKPTVEDLGLHYGEKMVFDDDKCTIELPDGSVPEPLGDVFVRATNKRIIIGLGGKRKHLLKYVIYYDAKPAKSSGDKGLGKKGYVSFTTDLNKVSYPAEDIVRIEASAAGLDVPQWIQIKTAHIGNFHEAFRV